MQKKEIPLQNITGVACDGASVMVGNKNSFCSRLNDDVPHALMLKCICHSSALIASKSCEKLPRGPEELLRGISTYISGSAKRCAILQEFQDHFEVEKKKILKLSATRWLSLHQCVVRLLKNWTPLEHYCILACAEDKLKSAQYILTELQSPYTKAYLYFLKYNMNFFNTFNALFQSKNILIHKLYDSSVQLMMQLCQNFIKPCYLKADYISTMNVAHPEHFLPLQEIFVGSECKKLIENLPGKEDFLRNCLSFYICAAEECKKRLPLTVQIIKDMAFLKPEIALYHEGRKSLSSLASLQQLCPLISNEQLDIEWRNLPIKLSDEQKNELKALPVDEMWDTLSSLKDFSDEYICRNISLLAKKVLTLPHSNADAERVFSVVTDVKTDKRNRLGDVSLNSICTIRSALKGKGLSPASYEVSAAQLKLHNTSMYAFKNLQDT